MKSKNNKWMGAGLVSAFAASLCCIGPLLAVIAGTSGAAASFSWLEPLRPFLIAFTALVLGFAWYQKLKPVKEDDCGCAVDGGKTSFMQSKKFLGIISVFSIIMLTMPYYSQLFYPTTNKTIAIGDKANLMETKIEIKGMTCTGCESHVNQVVNNFEGVFKSEASYEKGNAVVLFDKTKVNLKELSEAIEKETGYEVVNQSTKLN